MLDLGQESGPTDTRVKSMKGGKKKKGERRKGLCPSQICHCTPWIILSRIFCHQEQVTWPGPAPWHNVLTLFLPTLPTAHPSLPAVLLWHFVPCGHFFLAIGDNQLLFLMFTLHMIVTKTRFLPQINVVCSRKRDYHRSLPTPQGGNTPWKGICHLSWAHVLNSLRYS